MKDIEQITLTYHAGNPPENAQTDVNEEICTTSSLQEDGKRREEDRNEICENVRLELLISI